MRARFGFFALVIFFSGVLVGAWLQDLRGNLPDNGDAEATLAAGLPGEDDASGSPSENPVGEAAQQVLLRLREGHVDEAVELLESLEYQLNDQAHRALRTAAIAEVGVWLGADQRDAAWRFVHAYLGRYPRDHAVLYQAADLGQMQGDWLAALDYLFRVLEYPASEAVAVETRQRIDVLVRSHATTLAQRREFETLVDFYERLIGYDPGNDAYRLAAAEWLLELGEGARAEAWLAEAAPDDGRRARLIARSRLSAAGIPVERDGQQLLTTARAGTQAVRLLVDTGATMTSLSPSVLRRIGASPEAAEVTVATASGTVRAQIYRVDHFEIGPLTLNQHRVIALELPTPGIDGLLGMDVLGQTGLPPLTKTPETH
jgi:clan AA aspartic protease (TIGR02281 family)